MKQRNSKRNIEAILNELEESLKNKYNLQKLVSLRDKYKILFGILADLTAVNKFISDMVKHKFHNDAREKYAERIANGEIDPNDPLNEQAKLNEKKEGAKAG